MIAERKKVRTLYIPLLGGKGPVKTLIHTATVRSDWTAADFDDLEKQFSGTWVKTRGKRFFPIRYLKHYTFNQLSRWKFQAEDWEV